MFSEILRSEFRSLILQRMFAPEQDYRQIIRREFERRCNAHRMYSLRAFARDLEVSPARLSEVLNGKKGLSREAAAKIAGRLGLNDVEIETFCDMVDSRHARAKIRRDSARTRLKETEVTASVHTLQIDAFQAISEWYHLAILQLIEVKGFRNDPAWIANRLEITPSQASSALERLKRLGLLNEKSGRLQATKEIISTPDIPSAAIRENHKQIRAKALLALETQPIEERDFSSIQMPIDSHDVAIAKKRIRDFRRQFCAEFSNVRNKDSVYCLSVDFFNLTRKGSELL